MSIYESNLLDFSLKAHEIYNALTVEAPIFDVEIEKVDGPLNFIMTHNGCRCFVNSAYNIEAEMANMVRDLNNYIDTVVVFGFGNGYIMKYLLKKFPELNHIVIIEPALDLFKEILSHVVFKSLSIKQHTFTFLLNESIDEIKPGLAAVFQKSKNIAFIEHISYRTLFSSYYQQVNSIVVEILRTQKYNVRTLSHSYLLWEYNIICNLKRNSLMLDDVYKYLEGKPAVIVSAGSSLNKNMHLLSQIKEKAVLFAGGSTVMVLANNGIKPHFRASIDGREKQKSLIVVNEEDGTPLIFRNMSNPGVVSGYPGTTIRATVGDDHIGRYINERKHLPYDFFEATPSVSNFIFEVVKMAKCNPIIFVGQDMCSYNDAKYAKGRVTFASDSKMNEIEMLDIYGNKVYTELNYLTIKYAFDEQVRACGLRVINATEGGLGIEGTEVKTLESVLNEDLADTLDFDVARVVEIETLRNSYNENHKKVLECLQEFNTESEEVLKLLKEVFLYIDNYTRYRAKNYKAGKLKKELDKINLIYKKLNNIGFFKYVVEKSTNAIKHAFEYKYRYNGNDIMQKLDSERAIIASSAEIQYKYADTFIKCYNMVSDSEIQNLVDNSESDSLLDE